MSKPWQTDRINPLDWLAAWYPDADLSHITFNPDIHYRGRYFRGAQGGNDGTMIGPHEDISRVLLPFLTRETYCKADQPDGDLSAYDDIRYELGWVRVCFVYGSLLLRCSPVTRFPGMRWRVKVRADATLIPKRLAA